MYDMHGCPALKPFSRSGRVDIVCSPTHIVFTSKYPVGINTHTHTWYQETDDNVWQVPTGLRDNLSSLHPLVHAQRKC